MAAPLIPLGMGLARAAPWLARLGPWLARGSGWGRKAKGIAGSPATHGVLRESTRPVAGSVRGIKGLAKERLAPQHHSSEDRQWEMLPFLGYQRDTFADILTVLA